MTELLRLKRNYRKLFDKALKVQDLEKADECTKAIIRIDEILMQVAEVKKKYFDKYELKEIIFDKEH